MTRRPLLLLLTSVSLFGLAALDAQPAFAHNSLESSTPSDGAVVAEQPGSMTFVFSKDVPLETLTVTLTDPNGSRSELPDSAHGDTARTVVTQIPELVNGAYSVRWRLVGPDGHAITGRVSFEVSLAAPATTAPASTVPAGAAPAATVTTTSVVAAVGSSNQSAGEWSTPGWLRWLLRYGSYLAIMTLAGVVVTEAFVWREVVAAERVRSLLRWAIVVIAVGALAQLLVLAGDIAGSTPWSSLGSLGTAAENAAGMALVIRLVLAFVIWLLVIDARPTSTDLYFDVVVLLSMGLLATWSFAGHSRSMRWPWIGVPVDVVHHGAAAAWIGGLVIVGGHVLRRSAARQSVDVMRNFSRVAAVSVIAIVATGVLQAIRLLGSPGALFANGHGRALLLKLLLLSVMLVLANRNRQRVAGRFRADVVSPDDVSIMRTMIRRELYVGLAILGVTASLVVTPPATSSEAGRAQSPSGELGR